MIYAMGIGRHLVIEPNDDQAHVPFVTPSEARAMPGQLLSDSSTVRILWFRPPPKGTGGFDQPIKLCKHDGLVIQCLTYKIFFWGNIFRTAPSLGCDMSNIAGS